MGVNICKYIKRIAFFLCITVSFSAFGQTISGKVFEDINYGGGLGRSYTVADASAAALSGFNSGDIGTGVAKVQLWNATGTSLLSSQDTDASGNFSFSGRLPNTTYRIRVVNSTVRSKRPLLNGATHTERGIQTFRTESTNGNGTLVDVTNEIGGRFPQNVDSGAGVFAGSQTWSTVVTPSNSTFNISGINFGFNFSTIVNTNDSGQGSLRQFVINSNKLDNEATNLAQDFTGSVTGNETSIFMIPTPSDPFGRTADVNYQTSGNNINALLITLVAGSGDLEITDNKTHIDATTQTINIGDTNTGVLGTGGTVGTDLVTLNQFQRKEIIIDLNTRGIEIQAQDAKIKGLHLYNGGGIASQTTGNLESTIWIKKETLDARAIIEDNILGYLGDGTTPNATILNNQKTAVRVQSKSTIQRNLFGNYTRYDVIVASPGNTNVGAGSIIKGNESRYKTNPSETFVDVMAIYDPDCIVEENLIKDYNRGTKTINVNGGAGIELFLSATNTTIRNNTIDNVPFSGIYVADNSDNTTIQKNIIRNLPGIPNVSNSGIGILGITTNNTLISQNSIYNNKTIGIDLAQTIGTYGIVSKNDNGDSDGGANGQLNFPILAEAVLNGNNITIKGFAKSGATIEFFIADTDPFNGSATAGDNTFSGSTRDYGEGQIYLGSLVEGSAGDVDNTIGSYNIDGNTETNINKFELTVDITTISLPAGVTIQKMTTLTATATISSNTSEFGPTIPVINPDDFDCDGIDNSVDLDDDNDGIPDSVEGTGDFDGDGIPNNLDLDSDGDGILDIIESGLPNISTLDSNNDGMIDLTNNFGNNGLLDTIETDDTPTAIITYTITNTEGDANFDFLDLDSDGDGITDLIEAQDPSSFITPSGNDINNNGIDDIFESNPITPINSDNNGKPNYQDIDSDDDGIPDNVEAQTTSGYLPPLGTDTDGDGLDDRYDDVNNTGLNPVATSNAPDYINTDSDADGIPDIQENGMANAISGVDTDGDGLDDVFEGANNNDGFDVNDEINDPSTDLPNTSGSGDVDYRESNSKLGPYNNGSLWLRGDIGVTGLFFANSWEDQSGLSRDFSLFSGGPGTASRLNFNKVVSFTGSESFQYTGVLDPRTMFIVYNDISTQTSTSPFTNTTGIGDGYVDETRIYGNVPNTVDSFFGPTNYINGDITFGYTNTPRPDNFQLHSRIYSANPSPNSETYYLGKDNTLANASFGGISGGIAEVILYSDAIIPKERQVVETYLAIKYGFTLGTLNDSGDIIEGDYILSDETTKVWDYTANTTFHNNIAGIGKDNGWNFFQKQSKSVNTNTLVTIGLTDIASENTTNSSTLTDKSYLVWGHNNGALTTTASAIPNVPTQAQCVTNERLNRTWKIVETGTITTTEIAFTKSLIDNYFTTTNSQKVLVVADDTSFTTNVVEVELDVETINSTPNYSAKYNFDGIKYFTIADKKEIVWLGGTSNWLRGSGANGSPNTDDVGRLLIIDAEGTSNHANLIENVNVKCAYIKANSKLIVPTSNYIEIADDLVLDGEIRLVGDGQLIQTHTGASKVYGAGKLFKDQQAKVPNVYRYHYWSSPVVEVGLNTYRVGEVFKDGNVPTSENSSIVDINWVQGLDGAPGVAGTTPLTLSNYWIYSNLNDPTPEGEQSGNYIHKGNTSPINIGQGFTSKSTGVVPQNFTFVGSPNDGNITFNLTPNTASLLGNPYPSALNTEKFINDNLSSIDGTLYFWEHTGEDYINPNGTEGHEHRGYQGGYSIRNLTMGISAINVPTSNSGLYDWETATDNGNNVSQLKTITIGNTDYNITADVTIDDSFGVDLMDISSSGNPTDLAVVKNSGLSPESFKVTFDIIVDINNIYLYNNIQNNTTNTITITPNNTSRNAVVTQTLTGNSGQIFSLNWTDVKSFTISSQNDNNIVMNDISFAKGYQVTTGNGLYHEPNKHMAVGQGFFVTANSSGGQVSFQNSQREYRNSDYTNGGTYFFRNQQKSNIDSIPILKLGMDFKNSSIDYHRQIGISFKQGNTFGYENGYDSKMYDLGTTDMYWEFDEITDTKLIIAGIESISDDLEIPITIVLDNNQNIELNIDEIKNIDKDLFIRDNITGNFYNLSNTIQLDLEKGTYSNRFYLTFKNTTLNIKESILKNSSINLFFDSKTKEIVILNKGNLEISKIELYTILGQKISEWNDLKIRPEIKLKVKNPSSAFYILNIKTEKGFINRKLFIK
ncbi:right-handed parallel beta-helix repeat-containing protein [Polaribacter pectinis]|uniref:Right-handed parallel beta-helix repeat-containing protein n=1 Tax=Polaribacter pectinis TaxID=2738844 RepID=A0A7G9L7G0_9FLAO|nr:right-handed parallel beta-helix repeat-containing protein [Polaribacter pectinis]QNM84559.1 right-handed parallel beta-helix repeat-containing protein [Polaribacter pectinis]